MTKEQKKNLIKQKLENGDKRSYNEIQADMELQLWTIRHNGFDWTQNEIMRRIK